MTRSSPLLLALFLTLPATAPAEPPEVAPGALVRWPGEGIESCALGGERWAPADGACWYALDLLTPAGRLELARRVEGVEERTAVRVAAYPYPEQRIEIEDDSKVNLSAADVERSRRESARISELWGLDSSRSFRLPLVPPLDPLPPGGRFGARRVFNDEPRSPHTGADYAAPAGAPVRAAGAGTVALTGDFFFSGRSVFIDHGDGLLTMYFHLSEIAVEEGGRVERGERIGAVGQSGRATGPHLHFGARWRGARIDPRFLFAPPTEVPTVP